MCHRQPVPLRRLLCPQLSMPAKRRAGLLNHSVAVLALGQDRVDRRHLALRAVARAAADDMSRLALSGGQAIRQLCALTVGPVKRDMLSPGILSEMVDLRDAQRQLSFELCDLYCRL